ncbi:MAG TPA: dihydrolipoyl dehydrogenase [Exilispira sp.]|nr:dihydrolipoyl dehydrogenase [Exilispira sp.]
MNTIACEIAIIGGGPGGYVAAIMAAKEGKKVVLIEKKFLGGTCTNVGCIPTKAMLASANIQHEVENGKRVGLNVENAKIDFSDVMKHVSRTVQTSRKGIELLLKKDNLTTIFGEARFFDEHTIVIKDTSSLEDIYTINAENIIIATGSVPVKFPPFDKPEILTSDDIWDLDKLPASLGIIGGGVIGCEFSTFFSLAGVKVHIFEMMPTLIPTEDEDVAKELLDGLKRSGNITISTGIKVKDVNFRDSVFTVRCETKDGKDEQYNFDAMLLSIGRKPVLPEGVEKTGIKITEKGFVDVDEKMRTSKPCIYAIGDITGKLMLAHTASKQGEIAVSDIIGKGVSPANESRLYEHKQGSEHMNKRKIDFKREYFYKSIPSVIFTIPEIASVGLKEKDCINFHINYLKGVCPIISNGKARATGQTKGFVKVLVEPENHTIIGASIVGTHATDMIMEASLAVFHSLTVEDIFDTVHPHPTLTEAFVEAALASIGKAIHI